VIEDRLLIQSEPCADSVQIGGGELAGDDLGTSPKPKTRY
jgi:hypothetical protein